MVMSVSTFFSDKTLFLITSINIRCFGLLLVAQGHEINADCALQSIKRVFELAFFLATALSGFTNEMRFLGNPSEGSLFLCPSDCRKISLSVLFFPERWIVCSGGRFRYLTTDSLIKQQIRRPSVCRPQGISETYDFDLGIVHFFPLSTGPPGYCYVVPGVYRATVVYHS